MTQVSLDELEEGLIRPPWTEEQIANFPAWLQGDLREPTQPTGIGHHPETGWYALRAGQSPFLIWKEKAYRKDP